MKQGRIGAWVTGRCLGTVLVVLILGLGGGRAVAGEEVRAPQPPWDEVGACLRATLGRIGPELQSLFLRFEVTLDGAFLGSGTVAFRRDGESSLHLFATSGSCRFQHTATASFCLLERAGERVAFSSVGGGPVPFPVIRVDPDPDGGYQLNLMMNMSVQSATHPMDLAVAPGAADYILERIRTRFPVVQVGDSRWTFGNADPAPAGLVLRHSLGEVTGASLRTAVDATRTLALDFLDFSVNRPFPAVPAGWVTSIDPGKTPKTALEGLPVFIQGFYGLLRELLPPR